LAARSDGRRQEGATVIHEGEETLRNRALAAISRQRLDERLKQRDAEQERCAKAHARIRDLLGIEAGIAALPVELDGLEFTVEEQDGEWVLCLLRPCRSLLHGPMPRDCAEQVSAPIRSLADLGAALEDGAAYCAWCDD
jgi:hypothetical protein